MRANKRTLLLLSVSGIALLLVILTFLNSSRAARLQRARHELDAVFEAHDSETRLRHAQECVRVSRQLLDPSEDEIGTTAALFVIGLQRIVGNVENETAIPPGKRVKVLPSADLLRISRLLFNTRRFAPADQLVGIVLDRRDDHREDALRLATMIRFDLGRDLEVLSHCKELMELTPGDIRAYRVAAMVHRNHGHWEKHIDVLLSAIENTQTNNTALLLDLFEAYLTLGQTSDARKTFDELKASHWDIEAEIPVLYAKLLVQENKPEAAAQMLQGHLSLRPNDTEALLLHGTLLVGQNQFEEAIKELQKVIAATPAQEKAHYQMAQAFARLGDQDQARLHLDEHRSILDTKVLLHEMEQVAARDPLNVRIREEIAHKYAALGLMELADFWTRASLAASAN